MRSDRTNGTWGALLTAGLLIAGCANILGVTDGKQQGACDTAAECAPRYGCIQGRCRSGCSSDQDCDTGSRCLKVLDTSGCIPLSQGCGSGCPTGTGCVDGACRTSCSTERDCAGGQSCEVLAGDSAGVCVGTDEDHDQPPDVDASSMGGDSGAAGSGGTNGGGPNGNGGAGGEGGEPPAVVPQCSAGKQFCAGNELRLCADDGLSSMLVSSCDAGKYCDSETATCKSGACTPQKPACDGNKVALCNFNGSGFDDGGEDCRERESCSGGECKAWLCEPGATFCQGFSRYECSANGLSSSEIEICKKGTFCQENAGSSACTAQLCQPNGQACEGNTAKQCNAEGSGYATVQDCSLLDKTCVGGACGGECAPMQLNCGTGNKLQACDSIGHWTSGTECSAGKTCYAGACGGECGPGAQRCSANALQTCDETGNFVGAPCPVAKTCLSPGGAPACSGECGPTQTSCVGTVPQTCDAAGKWKPGAIVKDTCGAACTPGGPTQCSATLTQTCKSDGSWGAAALVVGKCGAECAPDSVRCSSAAGQACSGAAVWGTNGSSVPCKCWVPDRFKRVGAELARDTTTGLVWDAEQRPAAKWSVASQACADAGMRLPTYNEMKGVVINTTYSSPNCDHGFFAPFDSAGMPTSLADLGVSSASQSGRVNFWSKDLFATGAHNSLQAAYLADSTNYGWLFVVEDYPDSATLSYRCVAQCGAATQACCRSGNTLVCNEGLSCDNQQKCN